jgi:hypothetical protein
MERKMKLVKMKGNNRFMKDLIEERREKVVSNP